jgi:hypothetical protein
MLGAVTDATGRGDTHQAALPLGAAPGVGFGADFAVVSWGGVDPKLNELLDDAGLRSLAVLDDLGWEPAVINFGEGVRIAGGPGAEAPGEGLEVNVPWDVLYPELDGHVPAGASLAVMAVLVGDDGYLSNQALPPFGIGQTDNPGEAETPLPGLILFGIDADGDSIADGDTPPFVVP